jgi:hypothetical protein
MKWIFALNEKTVDNPNGGYYEFLAKVAVLSAKENAPSLQPTLIWNGPKTEFTEYMTESGVSVIFHQLSFQDSIEKTKRGPLWRQTAKGAMLRLDIPNIFKGMSGQVLYTDVDVLFLDDPGKYRFQVDLFGFSSEINFDDFKKVNTGVMILDLEKSRRLFPDFINWTINNLDWIPDFDQGAIQTYFNGRWDLLDQRMNWKPYWGANRENIIVHFHGPKPHHFDPISLKPKFETKDGNIFAQLFKGCPDGYIHYLNVWHRYAYEQLRLEKNIVR